MISIQNISIRNKIVLMQVFTSLLVLSIFLSAFIITDINDYKTRKANSIMSLAHVIGTNSISAIQFGDNEAGEDILAELKNVAPEITEASIYYKNNKLLAAYKKQGVKTEDFPDLGIKKFEYTSSNLYVTDDIVSNDEIIGKVSLQVELKELESIKKAKYGMAIILLAVAIGVSFLIALIIQPYISKRLIYLVDTMKQVGKTGDYSNQIAEDGKDEISTLIRVYNQLMRQVKESQHKKDEFIGIASHELKTPLTSIKGYLDLLNTIEERPSNKQCVEKALANVHKLEQLIKDLLDVSKIQSGQLQLNMKMFKIDALIEETINSFQMVSATHQILWENNDIDPEIFADRQRIEQVLINLLSNAIKYSPGENKVVVSSHTTDSELVIQVRDYGMGVPEGEITEIFERFYRTRDMSVHISGFGLGLYICKDIIKRHQGNIWVQKEEKGSSFYFSLPLQAKDETLPIDEKEISEQY